MPYALREFRCAGCEAPFRKRAKRGGEVYCIECAIRRSIENVYQQRSKSGLFYDRWAAGIMRAAREAETISAIGNEINSIG